MLTGSQTPDYCSHRANRRLAELREEHWSTRDGITSAEQLPDQARTRWWTWAGGRANSELGWRLAGEGTRMISADDLSVTVAGLAGGSELRKRAAAARKAEQQFEARRLEAIKFNAGVPVNPLETMCRIRDSDSEAIHHVLDEPVESARQSR